MLSLFLLFFASGLSAVCQRLTGSHFCTSIFRAFDPRFWDRDISFNYVQPLFGYPLDAWLIAKIAQVLFTCTAIVVYRPMSVPVCDIIIYTGVWAMNFDIFFKLILRADKW